MAEYREIAVRMKAKFPSIEPEIWMRYMEDHATMVSAVPLATQVCEDADDDVFLACAIAACAKIVCSGDKHLLACNGWNGIEVLPPRLFCNRLQGS
jgi:predicted nucleic acid-binding protein